MLLEYMPYKVGVCDLATRSLGNQSGEGCGERRRSMLSDAGGAHRSRSSMMCDGLWRCQSRRMGSRGPASHRTPPIKVMLSRPAPPRPLLQACEPVLKALLSAAANAKQNLGLRKAKLVVSECYANEGPVLKRFRPRAQVGAGAGGGCRRLHSQA